MTLKIDGMSCGHCVAAVDRALKSLQGVEVEQVSIGSASVRFDPDTTSQSEITDAIQDEGYLVLSTEQ
ncbi:MAG TPA: cation transporter [Gemmatimonadaceae bacterium]|jgi:copper chaperone|nr:cation transporter [Gemmatimonadaceae bacterium]